MVGYITGLWTALPGTPYVGLAERVDRLRPIIPPSLNALISEVKLAALASAPATSFELPTRLPFQRRAGERAAQSSIGEQRLRKLIATTFVTLDGVMGDPEQWQGAFWNEEATQYKRDELFASDAWLLGRVTYEIFAAAWPSTTDEEGFADRINSLPKYVVSTTLEATEWNNSHLIKENIAEEVSRLKQQPGQDITIHGSADLIARLMQHDLIDEYRLMVFPILVGRGKRLFGEGSTATLKLVDTKTFSTGVVVLVYRPAARDETQ